MAERLRWLARLSDRQWRDAFRADRKHESTGVRAHHRIWRSCLTDKSNTMSDIDTHSLAA